MSAPDLVILLHGVRAFGADVARLGEAWRDLLPATAFAAPDAPFPFDGGAPGRQWFSVTGVTAENRAARIAAARPAFDAVIEGIMDAHGLTGHPERVALVGYSQGAIMALDALATGRWPVAGVVALSGRLALDGPLTPPAATKLLIVHGTEDTVVPCIESQSACARLEQVGFRPEMHLLPGIGHWISTEAVERAGLFLAAL